MPAGKKYGGRKKGAPNRKTKKLMDKLDEYGFDPLIELIEIAQDPETPLSDKKDICKDMVQYIYPKRKAVEHSGDMNLSIEDYILGRPDRD